MKSGWPKTFPKNKQDQVAHRIPSLLRLPLQGFFQLCRQTQRRLRHLFSFPSGITVRNKSSIVQCNTDASLGSKYDRGVLPLCSHLLTRSLFTPSFSASCFCVMLFFSLITRTFISIDLLCEKFVLMFLLYANLMPVSIVQENIFHIFSREFISRIMSINRGYYDVFRTDKKFERE